MVNYVPMYDAFVQQVRFSEAYTNLTDNEKKGVDKFLENKEVIKYFEGKIVAQLSLHESLTLAFASSEALNQRRPEEQEKVMRYLGSRLFKRTINSIERKLVA